MGAHTDDEKQISNTKGVVKTQFTLLSELYYIDVLQSLKSIPLTAKTKSLLNRMSRKYISILKLVAKNNLIFL